MSNMNTSIDYFFTDKQSLLNYDFKTTIGQGTFGKVKMAINKKTNEKVAVKILNKKQIELKKEMYLVQRELDIIPKFNHINVIKVLQILQDEKNYYIIMEYCENGELFDHIVKNQKLTEEDASNFFYQLIHGIEHIHKNNIVHRDLKPENLLLTKNNVLKIIDFGLSSFFDGFPLLKTKCGSPSYAAPEIIKSIAYNGFKTDIWCCGIILYAMICGYLPFEGEGNAELFKNILMGQIEFPCEMSHEAKQMIEALLNPDPEDRIDINEIKQYKFYAKGRKNCKIKYESQKEKEKHLHIINSNNNILELNAFRNKFLHKNSNIKKYEDSIINSKISRMFINEFLCTTNANINKKQKQSYNNISLNPTVTECNHYIFSPKISLKSLIEPSQRNSKHSIPKIKPDHYIYNPTQLTNRYCSPKEKIQKSLISLRGTVNRDSKSNDQRYFRLTTEPKEQSKLRVIYVNPKRNKNKNLNTSTNIPKRTENKINKLIPRRLPKLI